MLRNSVLALLFANEQKVTHMRLYAQTALNARSYEKNEWSKIDQQE